MARGVLSEARPVSAWTEHGVMEVATGGCEIPKLTERIDGEKAVSA
jgi:hypothetical protein